jgi:hypothetical protein
MDSGHRHHETVSAGGPIATFVFASPSNARVVFFGCA